MSGAGNCDDPNHASVAPNGLSELQCQRFGRYRVVLAGYHRYPSSRINGCDMIHGETLRTRRSQSGVGDTRFMCSRHWVWLLWNDGPGGVEAALVLVDVELPVGIEVS